MENHDQSLESAPENVATAPQKDPLGALLQAASPLTDTTASNFVPSEQVVHPKKRKPEEKQERTTGLKLFDVFLYPFLTNFAVFGISVAATYLTQKGDKPVNGKLPFGKFGDFMAKRGKWLDSKFAKMGMNEDSVKMSRMVFFSFADGSLMAPVVKLFEDKREKIGKGIDEALGTVPEDLSVYKEEPKQSWWSVLGGRLATVSIVVPIAYGLDKAKLNKKFFYEPGEKLGNWLKQKPAISKLFKKVDLTELSSISVFEGFYTSVCTAGLYFSSRFFARKAEKKDEPSVAPIKTEADVEDTKRNESKLASEPKTRVVPQGVSSQRVSDPAIGATLA